MEKLESQQVIIVHDFAMHFEWRIMLRQEFNQTFSIMQIV
jgi:hypothetical protein